VNEWLRASTTVLASLIAVIPATIVAILAIRVRRRRALER